MRELNTAELAFVSGGEDLVYLSFDGNSNGGSTNPPAPGNDIYEGVAFFASHAVEDVPSAR